jgi:uncharacterized radical SAM superfamily protein
MLRGNNKKVEVTMSTPRILLINPPVNRLCDVAQNYFPLSLGYIAAVAKEQGFEVSIYNAEIETEPMPVSTNRLRIDNHRLFATALQDDSHRVWKEYREVLSRYKPDIVGFTVTSATVMSALKMAREAKDTCHATVIFGGMHPTILPEQTARAMGVDYIIVGDGEKSFSALLESLSKQKDPFSLPGVGGVKEGRFHLNAAAPLIDIKSLPFPDRDVLIDFEKHRPFLYAVITSRGCPYQCTFCSGRKITEARVRFRPVEDVIEEIQLLRDRYGTSHIVFYDDSLVLNKTRMVDLCNSIIKRELNITWAAFTRVDSLDEELLSVMKESGCTYLGLGVESGSERTLALIKKGYTRAQVVKGVDLIKKSGIAPAMNIIIGFPFEREKDIQDSIDLIEELGIATNVNTFTPYPGSELYDECVRLGLIADTVDWMHISQHSPYNAFVHEISVDRYRELLDKMLGIADRISFPEATIYVKPRAIKGTAYSRAQRLLRLLRASRS